MRDEQPAADAKKADGASCVALRTPIPPLRTGKVAYDQTESLSRLMFRAVLRMDRSSRSKSSRHGDGKHGPGGRPESILYPRSGNAVT